jgi:hypothetical protein
MDLRKADRDASADDIHGGSGESASSLFQPDVLVNDQYLETFRRGACFEPEKELMAAILEDAIETLQENRTGLSGRKQRLLEETEDWLFSDDANWIFSFVSVCGVLGLDPDYLRKCVRRRQLSDSASLN